MNNNEITIFDEDGNPIKVNVDYVLIPVSDLKDCTGCVTDTEHEYTLEVEGLLFWNSSHVECPLCAKRWVAVYEDGTQELECPNCGNMIDPIIIETEDH